MNALIFSYVKQRMLTLPFSEEVRKAIAKEQINSYYALLVWTEDEGRLTIPSVLDYLICTHTVDAFGLQCWREFVRVRRLICKKQAAETTATQNNFSHKKFMDRVKRTARIARTKTFCELFCAMDNDTKAMREIAMYLDK